MKLSVILTTIKDEIKTLDSVSECPFEHEVIISREKGLGKARNLGANKANNEVLAFFDDDLTLNPKMWDSISKMKKGNFLMAYGGYAHGGKPEPITRILIIHKEDFFKVGGFNEEIKYSGEDREFFLKAIRKGFDPKFFSEKFFIHKSHPIRFSKNRYYSIMFMFEQSKVLATHGAYTRVYKNYKRWFFPYIYHKEKSLRLFSAKAFWSTIRNLFACYNILLNRKYKI